MKKIGFVGLGTMGKPMAINLIKKGYPLTVFNRTKSKADALASQGANVASSPAELAQQSDVVFTNVSDDQALLDVMFGEAGILEGIRPGLVVIDCSTVSPETSRKISAALSSHMAEFLDAPVTGSKPAAEQGTLVFMVGGEEKVFREQADLFKALGSKAVYMGPSGSGSYAKLAHNLMVGINAVGFMEGMTMAAKAGLDPERFLEIVTSGGANSRQAELKGVKIINRDFSNQFSLKLMLKDLLLANKITSQMQLPTPMLHAATSIFQMGLSKGLGELDLSSTIQCYEEWGQTQVVKKDPSQSAADVTIVERRRDPRISLDIKIHLSVYQWEKEGAFSGQTFEGILHDLSEGGLQIGTDIPLAVDMFVVLHFPQDAGLPPLTAKIIRVVSSGEEFRYGCMLTAISPYTRAKLEEYIIRHRRGQE